MSFKLDLGIQEARSRPQIKQAPSHALESVRLPQLDALSHAISGQTCARSDPCQLDLRQTPHELVADVGEDVLADFELGRVLGAGTVGTVCLGTCKKTRGCFVQGQEVALKIQSGFTEDEQRTFHQQEYELLSSLQHPSITSVYNFYECSHAATIVMEYCECGSLQDYVDGFGPLSETRTTALGLQLVEGVNYLHMKRIVHRDLKPFNLLLKGDADVLKIADFNSAQLIGGGLGASLMLSARGTADFLAPEILFGPDCNELVDVWACGLCLFFAIRGELPFHMSKKTVKKTVAERRLPNIDWGVAGLQPSKMFRNLIAQCLTVHMPERPPAMELLLHPAFRGATEALEKELAHRNAFMSCPGFGRLNTEDICDPGHVVEPEAECDERASSGSLTRKLLAACELYGVPADRHPDSGTSSVSSRRLSVEAPVPAECGTPNRANLHPSLDMKNNWSVAGTDPLKRLQNLALNRCANTMHLDACSSAVSEDLVLRQFGDIEDMLHGPVDEEDFESDPDEQLLSIF